jgi:hypothetical protein
MAQHSMMPPRNVNRGVLNQQATREFEISCLKQSRCPFFSSSGNMVNSSKDNLGYKKLDCVNRMASQNVPWFSIGYVYRANGLFEPGTQTGIVLSM